MKSVRETAPSRLCQRSDLGRLLGSGDEEAEVDGVDVADAVADELADERRPETMYRGAGPAAVGDGVVFVVDVVEASVVTESARRERVVSVS